MPSTRERFERLEETLQIGRQMWSGDEGRYDGTHYQLGRTLNRPQPIRTPPIMIGGTGGEGDVEWGEVDWHGHHIDGSPFEMRGVIIGTIREGLIAKGRLYVEPVEHGSALRPS